MSSRPPRILTVAAPHSSAGKTTVTLGILAALARRGLVVQSFKVGPDFIDPALHTAITGRPAYNLDAWIYGQQGCLEIVRRGMNLAPWPDILVVEGVMGLFDGLNAYTEEGSTAQMAKWLGAPVVLVADAKAQGRSIAALVKGFAEFDPELPLAGVLCNKTGSDRHRELLREALEVSCHGVPFLGCLKRSGELELPSRHLGLHTAAEGAITPDLTNALARWLEDGLDLDRLLAGLPRFEPDDVPVPPRAVTSAVRIGIAQDRAFCFFAPENSERLKEAGCELAFFSPLADAALPENLDGLILGGGYPELYARELAANTPMLNSIRNFAASERPVWGACGGFMYLMDRLMDADGEPHPMAGLFPLTAAMNKNLRSLGYRQTHLAGLSLRGHEFHYSALTGESKHVAAALAVAQLEDAAGKALGPGVFRAPGLDHCYGTYMHVHLGSAANAAQEFARVCLEEREKRG